MILEEQLQLVINEQKQAWYVKEFVPRKTNLPIQTNRIVVISGVRRCGKSTFLQQTIAANTESLHLNFEDLRLSSFNANDFYKIENIAAQTNKNVFIFDEIQNIPEWERYIRSAHDRGKKIYITGSNASLLSKELGTHLTGRYVQIELFPFQYSEYLQFCGQAQAATSYLDFLEWGGFPEFLNEKNKEYLRTLLKDIIIRDIVVRRSIRNEQTILQLAIFLMSNIGKELSYNNISKLLEIKSVRSTIDYCDYLQESYLLEFVPRFSYSVKQQIGNPKKVYAIDTAMAKAVSLSKTDDLGRMLENAVYLEIRTKCKEICYFKDEKTECDFIVKTSENKKIAIQVCWQLTPENLQRELNGLKNAVEKTNADIAYIITYNQEDTFEDFQVIPVWKWNFGIENI